MNEVKFKANIKDVLALQAEVAALPEIPTPVSTDEGKVLTVAVDSSGETPVVSYELDTPASGLPAIESGDAGKVLTVNAGETGAEWATVPAELPAIGDSDAGKVLKVNAGHTGVEWGSAGGNSPLIVNSTYDETDEFYHLDKTFGEIRAAINAGQIILILMATSGSLESHSTNIVQQCTYTIGNDPEYPEASGAVVISSMQYDVRCESAPYTLTALDALYPLG